MNLNLIYKLKMNVFPGIKIIDLALYFEECRTLVIGDLHLGYEEMLNKKGILVPFFQYKKIIEHMDFIFRECKPDRIIIAGDLKHEFGTITDQEWGEVLRFLDYLSLQTENIILIKGNHDTVIGPIANKKNIKIFDNYCFENENKKIYVTHGHYVPDDKDFSDSDVVVIGHEHPAIALRDETRSEKIKCFLKGSFRAKNLIVIPSFNFLTEGTDVASEGTLSPFLDQDIGDFEVYAVEKKEVLYFGKLNNLLNY